MMIYMHWSRRLSCLLFFLFLSAVPSAESGKGTNKGKKSILDLTEADAQRIYEQWEVTDRPSKLASRNLLQLAVLGCERGLLH